MSNSRPIRGQKDLIKDEALRLLRTNSTAKSSYCNKLRLQDRGNHHPPPLPPRICLSKPKMFSFKLSNFHSFNCQVLLTSYSFVSPLQKGFSFLSENGLSGLGAYYIIEKRTRINYTENLSSRIFIYSFLKANHNLPVKTQFLRRVLSIIFTVYYFLDVILSIYRFKKDCFPFKDGIQSS